jgi:hypothetical protein
MPAATFTFYNDFIEQIGKAGHNLSTNNLKWALTNAAPDVTTHILLADITQLSTGGGYTGGAGGGVNATGEVYTETAGSATFTITSNTTITASGGTIGPFRYAVLYNDTNSGDALIGYLDYGSSITLADGEALAINYAGSHLFTVAKT